MTVSSVGGVSVAGPLSTPEADGGVVAIARSEPMDASALAVALVPELSVTVLTEDGAGGATLLVVRQRDGHSALIELGDGYLLDIDRARASVLLSNAGTGLQTTIWGENAAITLSDGDDAARFWGNVTFALDNGAVITAATAQREGNPLVYVLDSLTVTKREAAVIVANIVNVAGAEAEAEVAITVSDDGWTVEYRTADGMVLEQDEVQAGWVREGAETVANAASLAETAPSGIYGPNSDNLSGREFERFVSWSTTGWAHDATSIRPIPLERPKDDSSFRAVDRAAELRRIYTASLRPSSLTEASHGSRTPEMSRRAPC